MKIDLNIYVHLDPSLAGVLAGIATLLERTGKMSESLDNLTREVGETRTVMDSAIVLLGGLKQALDEAIASGDPAALTALSDSLDAGTNALAAAVAANTPAAPPVP